MKSTVAWFVKEITMGVRERKEREKEQRRIDILESARQAFVKYRLEQTSMDRIAQEAELAKGTLYLYFKNRDELLIALIADDFDRLIVMLEGVTKSNIDPEKKLLASIGTFNDFSKGNEFFYQVMTQFNIRSLIQQDAESEPVCHFRSVNQRMMELLTSVVQEGVNKKVFFIDQPIQDIVVQLIVSLKGAMVILRNNMLPPEWMTHDVEFMLHSIACLMIKGLKSDEPPVTYQTLN
jgi:AcrR family transcriptional regulator